MELHFDAKECTLTMVINGKIIICTFVFVCDLSFYIGLLANSYIVKLITSDGGQLPVLIAQILGVSHIISN